MQRGSVVLVVWLLSLVATVEIEALTQKSAIVNLASSIQTSISNWLLEQENVLSKRIDAQTLQGTSQAKLYHEMKSNAGLKNLKPDSDLSRDVNSMMSSTLSRKIGGIKMIQAASRTVREASRLFVSSLANHIEPSSPAKHLDKEAGVTSLLQSSSSLSVNGAVVETIRDDSRPALKTLVIGLSMVAAVLALIGTFLMDSSVKSATQLQIHHVYGMFERLKVVLGPEGGVLSLFSSFGFGLAMLLISFSMITRVLLLFSDVVSLHSTYADMAFLLSSANPFVICNLGAIPENAVATSFRPVNISNTESTGTCVQPKTFIASFNNPRYEIPSRLLDSTAGKHLIELAIFTAPTLRETHPFVSVTGYNGHAYDLSDINSHLTVGWSQVYNSLGTSQPFCRFSCPSQVDTCLTTCTDVSPLSFAVPFATGKAALGIEFVTVGVAHFLKAAASRPSMTELNIATYDEDLRNWCQDQKPLMVTVNAQDLAVYRSFYLFAEGCSQFYTDRDLSNLM